MLKMKFINYSNHIVLLNLVICFISLVSCTQDNIAYYKYINVPNDGWERHKELPFPIDSINTNGTYKMTFLARTTKQYDYKNLCIIVNINGIIDTANIVLNTNTIGRITEYRTKRNKQFYIKSTDSVDIRVSHIMTKDILYGIEQIGICIEKSDCN